MTCPFAHTFTQKRACAIGKLRLDLNTVTHDLIRNIGSKKICNPCDALGLDSVVLEFLRTLREIGFNLTLPRPCSTINSLLDPRHILQSLRTRREPIKTSGSHENAGVRARQTTQISCALLGKILVRRLLTPDLRSAGVQRLREPGQRRGKGNLRENKKCKQVTSFHKFC